MAGLKCIVVTPERTALDQVASFVVAPLFDGEFGIGPGHAPMIGRLGFGELRVKLPSGQVDRYYVDGGFVQVNEDVVTLLTGRIVPADQLDVAAAQTHLREAMKRPVTTDELLQLRDRAVEQARSQIRVAQRAK
jgi:F-type H+-transporting ATPase subunit epsilon